MKLRAFGSLFLALSFLSGCESSGPAGGAGGGVQPADTGNGANNGQNSNQPSKMTLYVSNIVTNLEKIEGYRINASDGSLSPLNSVVAPTFGFYTLAASPTNTFLFAPNGQNGLAYGYPINTTSGNLGSAATSSFSTTIRPSAVAVNPAGTRLFIAGAPLESYAIQADGTLTDKQLANFYPANTDLGQIVVAPNGNYLFVALPHINPNNSSKIGVYAINANGSLTYATSIDTSMKNLAGIFVSPDSSKVVVAGLLGGSPMIRCYDFSSGNLLTSTHNLVISGPAGQAIQGTLAMTMQPDGSAFYVTHNTATSTDTIISTISFNAGAGLFTGITYATSQVTSSSAIAASPDGNYVYVAGNGLDGFKKVNGSLQHLAGSLVANSVSAMVTIYH